MALVKCKECSTEISTEAKSCPKCGAKQQKKMGLLGWIAILFVGFFVYRCTSISNQPTPIAQDEKKPVKTLPKMSFEEREKVMQPILKGFKKSEDKMEKVSFYTKNASSIEDHLSTYIAITDAGFVVPRISVNYYGEHWIFWERFKVMADDVIVYEKSFNHSDIRRTNESTLVFESKDFRADSSDLDSMRIIANSKKATIRLAGRDKQEDYNLSEQTKKDIRATLDAYDQLKATLK